MQLMASLLTNETFASPTYQGLASILEIVNDDGKLTHSELRSGGGGDHAHLSRQLSAGRRLRYHVLDRKTFPPDQMGGWFGSSRRRVTKICKNVGVHLDEIEGEDELKAQLTLGNPVIMMLGVKAGKFLGFDLPGGHSVVAYGYDDANLYLTNWNQEPLPWAEFAKSWGSFVPRLIQMSNRGLVARLNSV